MADGSGVLNRIFSTRMKMPKNHQYSCAIWSSGFRSEPEFDAEFVADALPPDVALEEELTPSGLLFRGRRGGVHTPKSSQLASKDWADGGWAGRPTSTCSPSSRTTSPFTIRTILAWDSVTVAMQLNVLT